jgi:hypothetical protein
MTFVVTVGDVLTAAALALLLGTAGLVALGDRLTRRRKRKP